MDVGSACGGGVREICCPDTLSAEQAHLYSQIFGRFLFFLVLPRLWCVIHVDRLQCNIGICLLPSTSEGNFLKNKWLFWRLPFPSSSSGGFTLQGLWGMHWEWQRWQYLRVIKFWLLGGLLIALISLGLTQSWIDYTKQDGCICINLHT